MKNKTALVTSKDMAQRKKIGRAAKPLTTRQLEKISTQEYMDQKIDFGPDAAHQILIGIYMIVNFEKPRFEKGLKLMFRVVRSFSVFPFGTAFYERYFTKNGSEMYVLKNYNINWLCFGLYIIVREFDKSEE